ncbi:MAG: cell division protein ZipA C-terminal FtsZ-binding domain-containing protein [Methylophilaceae bacterium]|nr:cell division protein ZipA C-terminal FtsZ-binding domain-containing protein [Methyloradius sp.]
MNDLKLLLILLGVVIILAVIAFNWWQERRLKNETSQRFEAPKRDVLMDEFHIDTDAVLTDDDTRSPDISRRTYQPLETPVVPDAYINDDSAVARAVSALQEFEDDIAKPIEEVESPQEVLAEPAAVYEEEDTSDLMAESGFTESGISGAPVAAKVPARKPYQPPASQVSQPVADEPEYGNVSLPETIYHPIDLTALLYLREPLSGLKLRDYFLSFADVDKAVYAYGQDLDNEWRLLTREEELTDFKLVACSLQLADRAGSVSHQTLNRFQSGIDQIGLELAAQVEWHGSPDPLNYAQDLDQFCIDVDKLVGFHLVQGESGPFTGTKFRGLAEASGMVLGEDGGFHYESDGQRLFSLVNQDGSLFSPEVLRTTVIRGVSFQLDIPRVKNCSEIFNQMVLVARQMSHGLNAILVDDNQRPIGELQIERIRQQLKVIHAQMVTRGVVPGSPCALRLFS